MPSLPVFRYRWAWSLPAGPEALWPLVSDTDRFNRDTGLPPVEEVEAEEDALANARRRLRFSRLGLTVEWTERPFEWVRPWRFGVVRRYSRGPLDEMRVRVRLEPERGGGARLRYHVEARPSGLLGLVAIPLGIGLVSRIAFGRAFRRYAREVGDEGEGEARARTPPAAATPLVERLESGGVAPGIARRLAAYVVGADDLSLARIRPYLLAELWELDRREVLEACLRATRAGVLDLRWDLLCPLCRGAKGSAESLEELRTGGVHCHTCRIDFSADMERSVELTFTPNPGVREVEAPAFCVAGPQITPHVVVQQLLEPGEERTVRPRLEPGRYRLRSLDGERAVPLRIEAGGAAGVAVRVGETGWSLATEAPLAPAPELRLRNEPDRERLVLVERTAWSDEAVTGAEVTRLQTFRDLFAGEVLRAGEFLAVGSLAVLFTDLKSSTRLYREVGDGVAFGRVMEHFDALREAIEPEDGTEVKTMGDSVMAVFDRPAAAVRAMVRAQRHPAEGGEGDLVLKAGLHYGPCFTVRANDRLDYFGTTVNVAARLQHLARGGDLVVSERVRRDPEVEALVEEGIVSAEALHPLPLPDALPGLEDLEVRPWRITPGEPSGLPPGRSEA